MKIHQADHTDAFVKHLRNWKVIAALLAMLGYSAFLFLAGGLAHQKGLFGQVIKPIITENIRIPVNYVRGLMVRPEHIMLDIQHIDFQKLAYKREQALKDGVLHVTDEDYVSGQIRWRGKTIPVDVRLKGDLADHWYDSTKWSFRIKTKGDRTVLGMKKFSLQHPRTRGFLNDWYLYRLLEYFGDIIVLRYDFVSFTLNGKELGTYLIEEHFEEMLLRNNNRVNAPIVRIYDHLLWYNIDPQIGFNTAHLNEHYTLSPIDAFNTGTIQRDPILRENFNQAKNLFESFRLGRLAAHEVFDVDKLTEIFAIIDLLGYHHTTAYSNIRFYYDPVRALLVPIGYDNTFIFPATSIQGQWKPMSTADGIGPEHTNMDRDPLWYETFFRDEVFFRKYIQALEKVSRKEFLDDFFMKTDPQSRRPLAIIHRTFPGYRFEHRDTLYANAEFIGKTIDPLQGIQAYFHAYDPSREIVSLELGNIQPLPMEVVGLSLNGRALQPLAGRTILQPKGRHRFISFQTIEYKIPQGLAWNDSMKRDLVVSYRIIGASVTKTLNPSAWSHLDENFPSERLRHLSPNVSGFAFLKIDAAGKRIDVLPGTWTIAENLMIPAGWEVHCDAGTTLVLKEKAMVLSYSPIHFRGRSGSPIVIQNDSGSPGQGVAVIHAERESELEHVIFQGLDSLSVGDWKLSSGITFYESPVRMSDCRFIDIEAPAALAITRTEFSLDRVTFLSCRVTSLDITYSEGTLAYIDAARSGGTSIHLTGSMVSIHDVTLSGSADRALVCTGDGVAQIRNLSIYGAKLGAEFTNGSRTSAEGLVFENCRLGIAVHRNQRDSEPPYVAITGIAFQDNERDHVVEQNSTLVIDGREIGYTRKMDTLLPAEVGQH